VATKKDKQEKGKKSKGNPLARWWRETIGELRKVTWPTPIEAWRLTKIVLVVMVLMSALLGILDFIFSKIVTAVLA
jgi:preprotein translocase subunit SecE